jgi:predicted metal-binding protein
MKSYSKFIKKAVALGADDAKIIKTDTIVTGPWVRWKCRYGCDGYNSSLCCPPDTPDYHETRELVDSYKKALLVHITDDIKRSTDLSSMARNNGYTIEVLKDYSCRMNRFGLVLIE